MSFNAYKNISDVMAVFSRMRGNRILERLTVQDCNTPHSCDYRYIQDFPVYYQISRY